MTDILADLAGLEKRPGIPCVVARLRAVNPQLAEQFDLALASDYQASAIARWFEQHDYPIDANSVRRHRNGQCVTCRTS